MNEPPFNEQEKKPIKNLSIFLPLFASSYSLCSKWLPNLYSIKFGNNEIYLLLMSSVTQKRKEVKKKEKPHYVCVNVFFSRNIPPVRACVCVCGFLLFVFCHVFTNEQSTLLELFGWQCCRDSQRPHKREYNKQYNIGAVWTDNVSNFCLSL